MAGNATYPRTTWIIFSTLIAVALIAAIFPAVPLRIWSNCGGCASSPTSWDLRCWLLMGGGAWVTVRTYLGFVHWLTWWYRRGHWLPPSRPELDTYPNDQASWNAMWSHPDFGVLRPWANLDLYSRIERVEIWAYTAFAAWVLWQLSDCHQCPRWSGDTADMCHRHSYLAGLPIGVLVCFEMVRAHFGPLPGRPARRN